MIALAGFRARTLIRGRATIGAALVFGVAAGLVAVVGIGSFQQLGLGAVGPAAAALVNLALLLPTAQAVVLGAITLTADRETGFSAMLLACGIHPAGLVLTAWLAVTLSAWLSILLGFALAAVVVAGSVPAGDLPVFGGLIAVALAASAAAAAVGVLVGAGLTNRTQAALVGVAVWFVLAVGLDLAVIGLGAFLRFGEPVVVAAILADPLSAARVAALLLLDASAGVLGPTGTYLLERLGTGGAGLTLWSVLLAWVATPLALAVAIVGRRDR